LTADAVLLSPKLATIVGAFQLARRTKYIVQQNFAWAILYNLIAVPLALTNVINPAWAAIGMGASGLIVVLNSMRLLRRVR
jgi:P-type Cu2+ transporter